MLRNFPHYVFDLDGTLIDSATGILNAYLYALESMGIKELDTDKIRNEIGAPLSVTFQKIYGMNDNETHQAILKLRDYYAETGIYENHIYPGIDKLLHALSKTNCTLYIATAKPQPYALSILKRLNLAGLFNQIQGSSLQGDILEKTVVLENLFKELPKDIDKSKMVMIGDSRFDIQGAQYHGMQSVAVTYGYGTLEVLSACRPDYTVHSVEELEALIV